MKQTKPIDAFLNRFNGGARAPETLLTALPSSTLGLSASVDATASNELSALVQSLLQQTKAVADNTAALGQTTQSVDSMGANLLSFARQSLAGGPSFGGGLLGFSPVGSLIGGLFHRSNSQPTSPELPKFEMPDPLSWDLGGSPSRSTAAEQTVYGENALPKPVDSSSPVSNQMTVNIQAMDARSFLERSGEIANALKSAMLHSSSLNDVMAEME